MCRRRRILISVAVLVACVSVALGVLAMLPPRPGVTKANFDRIKMGMALTEVEAILGANGSRPLRGLNLARWTSKDGALAVVTFDGQNKIIWVIR